MTANPPDSGSKAYAENPDQGVLITLTMNEARLMVSLHEDIENVPLQNILGMLRTRFRAKL